LSALLRCAHCRSAIFVDGDECVALNDHYLTYHLPELKAGTLTVSVIRPAKAS
jgi:hypothetical protein